MSASPPTASELWHRSEMALCARNGLMHRSKPLVIKKIHPKTPIESMAWVSCSRVGRRPVGNSLDYRIGHSEQLVRHSEAQRLGRLQIDYQLVFSRGLDRQ